MSLGSSEPVTRVSGLSKRAPRACESCRGRKVRCDVTRTRAPCTNCRLDSKTCVLPASRRRHVGDRILGDDFLEDKQHNPQSPICDAIIDFGDTNKPSSQRSGFDTSPGLIGNGSFDVFDLSKSPPTTFDLDLFKKDSPGHASSINGLASSQQGFFTSYPSPTQTLLDYSDHTLPNYITPFSKNITNEDLHYLNSKSAFDIPDIETRDQLLRAYSKWVHPFAPMLDLEHTLTAVFSDGANGTLSLLVFQSMLFAASAYVSLNAHQGGRKKTRKSFYERARLLHDFDVETDRLSICQAAILLSYWDGQPDSVRDSYHWIGVATLHATSIGLNSVGAESLADLRQKRTFKKTWWTLLVRDRLLAVAMRRPVQNKVFRFDAPMLHLADFRLEPFVDTVRKTLKSDLTVGRMEVLVSLWMALAQLSEYIDKVLSLQYTSQRSSTRPGQGGGIVSLVPKVSVTRSSEILACGQEMQNWYGYLPTEVQQVGDGVGRHDEMETIRVHRSLLAGYYSMTLMTLYRPLMNLHSSGPVETKLRHEAQKMVFQAAVSVTDIFRGLYTDGLITRLPDTAIAALEPAVATHLLYSMSETATMRETSFQRFYLCWRILLQFKQTYHVAETTMSMLDAAARRLKSPTDLKALKAAAYSQLMEEFTTADDEAARSYMTVPFVGVVGDQIKDRSDAAGDWTRLGKLQERASMPGQGAEDFALDLRMEYTPGLESNTFEQLMCWDDIEEEPLP
ncbi:hypothetical protein H2200_011015 [Cladophialophora chaetospira]|uniref:Zn(2)-C6 fungal-type domain-containing protein n=1 Tax=Cladophialophora chaetospira TaxID=386627 RepID=A0AA38WZU5_9EURO|nr:hypothetical protein H2200_011015 [Cladophialophora chaetospira]